MDAFIHSIKSGGWWPFVAVETVEIVCRYVPVKPFELGCHFVVFK